MRWIGGIVTLALLGGWAGPTFADAQEALDLLRFAPAGGQISSGFGYRTDPLTQERRFHSGLDIAAPVGTPIYAAQTGVVTYAGEYGGYGNVVVLSHGNNVYTLYGHTSELLVSLGQTVTQGQPVALMGATGRATGPHLHFEVHQGNTYKDPVLYLLAVQEQLRLAGKLPGAPAVAASVLSKALSQTALGEPELPTVPTFRPAELANTPVSILAQAPVPAVAGNQTPVEVLQGTQRHWLWVKR